MTRNAWDNQDHQNYSGRPDTDSIPGVSDQKRKKAGMEIDNNKRGYT